MSAGGVGVTVCAGVLVSADRDATRVKVIIQHSDTGLGGHIHHSACVFTDYLLYVQFLTVSEGPGNANRR